MTETLKQKLERFNFPEPDYYYVRNSCGWLFVDRQVVIYDSLDSSDVEPVFFLTLSGLERKRIKTDQDWENISRFIRFLKGESAND